jgi:predicted dehydrogenase
MLARDDIDMVCVSTSSQHHRALVLAAIAAGKHVFCEWPFGMTMTDALAMRDASADKGVRTLVGLQNRCAPIVAYVRDLIAQGYVGTLWSVNFDRANDQTARMALTSEYLEFLEHADAGLRIMGGHALDTLAAYVGEFADIQAYGETQMNKIRLVTGEIAPVHHKDHFLVQGRLVGGALASIVMKQNSPTYKAFHLEISGSSGAIIVTADETLATSDRHPGVPSQYSLYGTSALGEPFRPLSVPERYRLVPDHISDMQPLNVAHMYRSFSSAVSNGVRCELDFDHGVRRHELLRTISEAAERGTRSTFENTRT